MGWGGRIPLPSRSPDLIPIDFQQWRHIKEFTLLCLPDIIDRIHEQPVDVNVTNFILLPEIFVTGCRSVFTKMVMFLIINSDQESPLFF